MMSSASVRRLVSGPGPVILALLIVLAVLVSDLLMASERVPMTSLVIAAPLLCGLTASVTATRRVGILATAVAGAAFLWGHDFGSWRYWVPVGVVAMGSAFAVVTAIYRDGLRRHAQRMRVLADVAGVAHGGEPAEEIAAALIDVLVPRLVDLCAIDLIGPEGKLRRLAGAATGEPDRARELLGRPVVRDETGDGPGGPMVRDESGDGPGGPVVRDESGDGPRGPVVRDERETAGRAVVRDEAETDRAGAETDRAGRWCGTRAETDRAGRWCGTRAETDRASRRRPSIARCWTTPS